MLTEDASADQQAHSPVVGQNTALGNSSPVQQYDTVRQHPGDVSAFNDASEKSINGRNDSPTPAYSAAATGDSHVAAVLEPKSVGETIAAAVPSTQTVKDVASNAAATVSNAAATAATTVSTAASNAAASVGLTKGASSSGINTSPLPSSVPAETAKLQQELLNVRAEIERLRASLREKENELSAGLRQRNIPGVAPGSTKTSAISGGQVAVAAQEGVPLQMVGALVAATFFFTWLASLDM